MVLPRYWFTWLALSATLTMLMYLLFVPADGDVLYQFGFLRATESGLLTGARMGLRLVALVFLAALAATLSAPLSLAAGLTRVLLPLRRCRVPVETVFYFAFFLLRMFPLLVRESRLIRLAQQSRGIHFGGSSWDRVHSLPALIVPVFAAGMRRGDQLALALAARGFDTRRVPTVVTALRFHVIDWLLAGLLFVGWSLWVWLRIH